MSRQNISVNKEDIINESVESGLTYEKDFLLKKTVAFFSRYHTEIKDQDVYIMSWNIIDLPKPPAELSTLLSLDNISESDLVIIGLQNVQADFVYIWAAVIEATIVENCLNFLPVIPSSDPLLEKGTLLMIFSKNYMKNSIRNLSCTTLSFLNCNVVACRFVLYQAPICVINYSLSTLTDISTSIEHTGLITISDRFSTVITDECILTDKNEDLKKNDLSVNNYKKINIKYAVENQEFQTIFKEVLFTTDEEQYRITDHPYIIFLGGKDIDELLTRNSTILLNDKFEKKTSNPNNCFPILEKLFYIDFRFLPDISGWSGVKNYRGDLSILKAGVINLSIEKDGIKSSLTTKPEFVLARLGVPSINYKSLHDFYKSVWYKLKDEDDEPSTLVIYPRTIEIPTLTPFIPELIKFKIKNIDRLPAVYSILCLSETGKMFVPITQHSYFYRSDTSNIINKKKKYESNYSNNSKNCSEIFISNNNKFDYIEKNDNILLQLQKHMIGLKKKTLGNVLSQIRFPKTFNTLTSKPSLRKQVNKSENQYNGWWPTSRHSSSSITTQKINKDNSLNGEKLPSGFIVAGWENTKERVLFNSQKKFLLNNNQNKSQNIQEKKESLPDLKMLSSNIKNIKKKKLFELSRWIAVHPSAGVILGNDEIEVELIINIKESILKQTETTLLLAIHQEESDVDELLTITAKIIPTLKGLSLCELHNLSHSLISKNINLENNILYDNLDDSRTKHALPIPKEIWWLMKKIYQLSSTNDLILTKFLLLPMSQKKRLKEQIFKITTCLENGLTISKDITAVSCLTFLEDLASYKFLFEIDDIFIQSYKSDTSHFSCRAFLLKLPIFTRNTIICLITLIRWLYDKEIKLLQKDIESIRLLRKASVCWLSDVITKRKTEKTVDIMSHFFDTIP